MFVPSSRRLRFCPRFSGVGRQLSRQSRGGRYPAASCGRCLARIRRTAVRSSVASSPHFGWSCSWFLYPPNRNDAVFPNSNVESRRILVIVRTRLAAVQALALVPKHAQGLLSRQEELDVKVACACATAWLVVSRPPVWSARGGPASGRRIRDQPPNQHTARAASCPTFVRHTLIFVACALRSRNWTAATMHIGSRARLTRRLLYYCPTPPPRCNHPLQAKHILMVCERLAEAEDGREAGAIPNTVKGAHRAGAEAAAKYLPSS